MERFAALLCFEWRRIFSSHGFSAVGGVFLFLCSMLFLFVLHLFTVEPQTALPTVVWLQTMWVGSLVLVPLLTMRSVAEERSSGTLDCLLCTSVSPFTVILCKFLALFGVYFLLWAAAIAMQPLALRLSSLAYGLRLFSWGDLLRAATFLALVGALHCSVGLLFSTIAATATQAAAATSAAQLCYFFGPKLLSDSSALPLGSPLKNFLLRLEFFPFIGEWSAGIFDSRQIVFHVSFCAFALVAAAALLRRP